MATREIIKLDISVSKWAASVNMASEPEYKPPNNSENEFWMTDFTSIIVYKLYIGWIPGFLPQQMRVEASSDSGA